MKISQPTPELPVPDVQAAQAYYRDTLGFTIEWYNEAGQIGAVSHGDCAIFFRKSDVVPSPNVFWIFAQDVDHVFHDLIDRGADIVDPIRNTEWGMRQFTLKDAFGNLFYFHHDL